MGNKIFFLRSVIFLALMLSCSLLWNIYTVNNNTFQLFRNIGQSFFKEIETTRLWNAMHGGVYVPVTKNTHPNPYLTVPNRDITTISGLKLTLINPAFMTRQIAEIVKNESNIRYHLTSLKPIRPENRADQWEEKALTSFESGNLEVTEYIKGKVAYRYMAPLFVKQACLRCHEKQGYKIGDIRGGISVEIPAGKFNVTAKKSKNNLIIIHSVIFLLGVVLLYYFKRTRDRHIEVLKRKNSELMNEVVNRKKVEEQIKLSLKEKETLLKEIHHRVKNNMTVIYSLLGLQIANVTDEKASIALQDSQNRVQTMSMIHETLYRSDNLSSIDMQDYLSKLGRTIIQSHRISNNVTLKIEAENIMLNDKQASSLGLIVNELITNSLKYAFSNDKGEIVLELKTDNEDMFELIVSDNGVGIPEGFSLKNADSLGLQLVESIAERQLDGSVDIKNENGTKFTIRFKLDKAR